MDKTFSANIPQLTSGHGWKRISLLHGNLGKSEVITGNNRFPWQNPWLVGGPVYRGQTVKMINSDEQLD